MNKLITPLASKLTNNFKAIVLNLGFKEFFDRPMSKKLIFSVLIIFSILVLLLVRFYSNEKNIISFDKLCK